MFTVNLLPAPRFLTPPPSEQKSREGVYLRQSKRLRAPKELTLDRKLCGSELLLGSGFYGLGLLLIGGLDLTLVRAGQILLFFRFPALHRHSRASYSSPEACLLAFSSSTQRCVFCPGLILTQGSVVSSKSTNPCLARLDGEGRLEAASTPHQ